MAEGEAAGGPHKANEKVHVIHTGNLYKSLKSRLLAKPKLRYVILTNSGIHWFKRDEDGRYLVGEETGRIRIRDITGLTIGQDESFEVCTRDRLKRIFRASTKQEAQEWVEALTAVRAEVSKKESAPTVEIADPIGSPSHAGVGSPINDNSPLHAQFSSWKKRGSPEGSVEITDITAKLAVGGREVIFSRSIPKGSSIKVDEKLFLGDLICVNFSNRGKVILEMPTIKARANTGTFETPIESTSIKGILHCEVKMAAAKKSFHSYAKDPDLFDALVLITVAILAIQYSYVTGLIILLVAARHAQSFEATHKGRVRSFDLVIKDFTFSTSEKEGAVQEDTEEMDGGIPVKFIKGCAGDREEARRRWKITKAWREKHDVDHRLEQPHPNFQAIKALYPHFFCGRARNGDMVYYEIAKGVDIPLLKANGISNEDLLWHQVWQTEYLWNYLWPDKVHYEMVLVLDLTGIGLSDFRGETADYVKKVLHILQEHYCERCSHIIIANAPSIFTFIYSLLQPMLHEMTREKLKITSTLSQVFEALTEFVEPDQIPVEYGGTLRFGEEPNSCRWKSPDEVAMKEFVMNINAKHGVEFRKVLDSQLAL